MSQQLVAKRKRRIHYVIHQILIDKVSTNNNLITFNILQKKWVDYESELSDSSTEEFYPTPGIYVSRPNTTRAKKYICLRGPVPGAGAEAGAVAEAVAGADADAVAGAGADALARADDVGGGDVNESNSPGDSVTDTIPVSVSYCSQRKKTRRNF